MSRLITVLLAILIATVLVWAQPPDTLWTKTFGNDSFDVGACVQQTENNEYILVGHTTPVGLNNTDIWLIRTDANGDTLWIKTYDYNGYTDYGHYVIQTTDGGYIILGSIVYSSGVSDTWLIKTDNNGDTLWTEIYDIESLDAPTCIQQTGNGEYVIVGHSRPSGSTNFNAWFLRVDSLGVITQTKLYDYWYISFANFMDLTADDCFIITGSMNSISPNNENLLLMKVNTAGDTLWTKIYDNCGSTDYGTCVQQISSSVYIITGTTFTGLNTDAWLIKTNNNGDILWTREYNYQYYDHSNSVKQTNDGGYILCGMTRTSSTYNYDLLVIKTNNLGDELWSQIYDYNYSSMGANALQMSNGCYLICGTTAISTSTNKDAMLICLEPDYIPFTIILTPNTTPIQIPAGGGSFDFNITIENNTINPFTFDVWTEAILPGGNVHGPIILRTNQSLAPDTLLSRDLTQFIPANAPSGDYWYKGYVGTYPATIASADSFAFEKLPGDNLPTHNFDWQLFGWDLEESILAILPEKFIFSVYPNPFNQSANLSFTLPQASEVLLIVYDVNGREVAILADGFYQLGTRQIIFNASSLSSGIYFVSLTTPHLSQSKKLLLIK